MATLNRRIDPFTSPLDRLDYEMLYEAFRDVGAETQRLEFKQQLDPEELARQATAMANGSGGLIVVGFKDPVDDVPLERHPVADALDEPARRRLLSKIQARVYPSLPLDAAAYVATDGSHRALVLRVESSVAAPHENLNDRGRFAIRRGTQITGMTLRELETMIRRRDSMPSGPDVARLLGRYPMVALDRSVEEGFVGVQLYPETVAADEPLSRSRQAQIERLVRNLNGLNTTGAETCPQGILFVGPPPPPGAIVTDVGKAERIRRRAYVGADGHFEIRDTEVGHPYQDMLLTVLCNAYALGSQLFLTLGLGPRARGTLVCHRRSAPESDRSIAGDGEFSIEVDFSIDTAVEMARRPLMYALRTAGTLTEPDELDGEVAEFWRYHHSTIVGIDLREQWI